MRQKIRRFSSSSVFNLVYDNCSFHYCLYLMYICFVYNNGFFVIKRSMFPLLKKSKICRRKIRKETNKRLILVYQVRTRIEHCSCLYSSKAHSIKLSRSLSVTQAKYFVQSCQIFTDEFGNWLRNSILSIQHKWFQFYSFFSLFSLVYHRLPPFSFVFINKYNTQNCECFPELIRFIQDIIRTSIYHQRI